MDSKQPDTPKETKGAPKPLSIWVIILIYAILCCAAVWLFNSSTLFSEFSLSDENTSFAATALSGYTAPVIGLISVVLIYMAYTQQLKANSSLRDQNLLFQDQNNSENEQNTIKFITYLFEQMDKEIDNSYILWTTPTYSEGKRVIRNNSLKGYQAITKMMELLKSKYTGRKEPYQLGEDPNGKMLLGLANSFQIIDHAIDRCEISEYYKAIFLQKAKNYYYSKFAQPFSEIILLISDVEIVDSDNIETIKNLARKYQDIITIQELFGGSFQ